MVQAVFCVHLGRVRGWGRGASKETEDSAPLYSSWTFDQDKERKHNTHGWGNF